MEGVRDMIQDTESFVAANDDVILVVFRGTSEILDWVTNLRGAPRGVTWCPVGEKGCSIHRVSDQHAFDTKYSVIQHKFVEFLFGPKGFAAQQLPRNREKRPLDHEYDVLLSRCGSCLSPRFSTTDVCGRAN